MAELPQRLAGLSSGVETGLYLLLLIAFGLKAAVFPLYFWLPDSYPSARSPVTAVFAGLLTKVGVYAILRTQVQLFPDSSGTLLLYIAAITMVVGVLGAIAQNEIKRILSFHIVSQIGYMIFGIAIGGRRRDRGDDLLPHLPDPGEDVVVPRRRHGRARDGHQSPRSAQWPRAPLRVPRAALPASCAEPVGDPAVRGLRRQVRSGHRRIRRRPRRGRGDRARRAAS